MNRDTILLNLVNEFYYDSEDEPSQLDIKALNLTLLESKDSNSAVIRNFKPFEREKSFAMADRLLPQETKLNIFSQTQGFIACNTLNKVNLNTDYNKNIYEGNNSSYVITETELINCCDQAEKILENNSLDNKYNEKLEEHELKPDKSDGMLLVNAILQDFSQSPLRKEQIHNTSWQYTPEFRMRRRPVKNYSRKFLNSTKANLDQRFEECIRRDSSEYNDSHSSCSSLSIQEDVTLHENLHYQKVAMGNTQHICENLLNLSEYYAENRADRDLSDEEQIHISTSCQENASLLQNSEDLLNEIIAIRSMYSNKIRYDSYDSLDDFPGFHCNENSSMKTNITVSNNRQSNMSKESDNLLDYLMEDNCHDEIRRIKTKSDLHQENNHTKSTETHSVVDQHVPKLPSITESFRVPEIVHQNPDSINYAGFKTASLKPIKVSREAHVMAAKILSILPEIPELEENALQNNCDKQIPIEDENVFENPEDYEWNDDCDFFLNFKTPIPCKEANENIFEKQPQLINYQLEQDRPSTSKSATLGFKTAGGKSVHISNTAQMTVQKLLKEFTYDLENDYNYEEELRKMKCKVYAKSHNLETAQSLLSTPQMAKCENLTDSITDPQNAKKSISSGFCLDLEHNCKEDLEKETQGFHTENCKHETSKFGNSVENHFKNFIENRKDDSLTDSVFLTNEVNKRNDVSRDGGTCSNGIFRDNNKNPLESNSNDQHKFLQMPHEEGNLPNIDIGFQTANGKNVLISAKSKQAVEKLFQDLDCISNVSDYEHDIKKLKTKIQNKCKDLVTKSVEETNEYKKLMLNESAGKISDKRKISVDNSDLESPSRTPPTKIFKNGLHKSKSSFAEQTLKSPLSTATHSLILRKNLLSLTKKRRNKRNSLSVSTEKNTNINKNVCDLNMSSSTPVKSNKSLTVSAKTPGTPNLNEFFSNAPLTSTPQLNNPSKSTQIIEDSDLKPINWNNTNEDSIGDESVNKSMRTTKLSENSSLNITLNSSNPTVQERIDRLKMYGKAPAVSPILIEPNRNCRPSGLRRTRSMIKKIEK